MKKRMITIVLSALMAAVLVAACASDTTSSNDPGVGRDCLKDADCEGTQVCGNEDACIACDACANSQDCPDPATQICDLDAGCCKVYECRNTVDCPATSEFCIEYNCRTKQCNTDEDCSERENFYCNEIEKVCQPVDFVTCTSHEDCEVTNLCDLETERCISCDEGHACPDELECRGGSCLEPDADGDQIVNKMGCPEFKQGCMYEVFMCFDKLNPPGKSWSSCTIVEDDNGVEGYAFTFEDGGIWKTFGLPPVYHEARGQTGFCYKITEMPTFRRYTNRNGALLGDYVANNVDDLVTITCPDGSKEYYGFSELYANECPGFPVSGVYAPPTIEGCQQAEGTE